MHKLELQSEQKLLLNQNFNGFENGGVGKPALKAVLEDEDIKLHPKHYNNTYRHWLESIRDWVFQAIVVGASDPFLRGRSNDFVVAESIESAANWLQKS